MLFCGRLELFLRLRRNENNIIIMTIVVVAFVVVVVVVVVVASCGITAINLPPGHTLYKRA